MEASYHQLCIVDCSEAANIQNTQIVGLQIYPPIMLQLPHIGLLQRP